jgi:hypothetical protein
MIAPKGMKAHDMIRNRSHPTPAQLLSIAALAGFSLMHGCSIDKVGGTRTENPERLSIADFTGAQAEQVDRPDEPELASAAPTSTQGTQSTLPRVSNTDGVTIARSAPQARPVEIENPTQIEGTTQLDRSLQLLDAKIGDVNGKPIFTSSFFSPIEDRLIAEAERLSLNEWRASAGRVIAQRLDGIIADELLRAEALAALTPTQRVGLQAFLSNFRNNLLSENLGSSQLAERRILEQEGLTLDQALRQKEVDTLVQLTLIREINRRVNVSWRDIRQRYDRDIDQFAPPPSAVLRVIRAFKDDEETVTQIQAQLDRGESFIEIAMSELNTYSTETLGVLKRQIEGSFEETPFFGRDELNDATHQLSIGEHAGPVELGSSYYWILYEDQEQQIISLYDAQLAIQRELTFERREQARDQYLARLQERARVSSRDEVLMRLFEIADERYAPTAPR